MFHNAKFDLQKLIRAGVVEREAISHADIEDTEALAALIRPYGTKRLKALAKEMLGLDTDEAEAIKVAKRELVKQKRAEGIKLASKDIGYDMLPMEVVEPYAIKDAEFTWVLWKHLRAMLPRDMEALYRREMELTLVLLDIEARGMAVDRGYIQAELKRLNGEILKRELAIQDATGLRVWYPERSGQKTPEGCINPNSPAQLMEQFGDVEGTSKAILKTLDHPLAQLVLGLREDKKMRDTYLANMLHDQQDGIIHPSYRQHEPKTGRMSSAQYSGD